MAVMSSGVPCNKEAGEHSCRKGMKRRMAMHAASTGVNFLNLLI